MKLCNCESGLERYELVDASGIFCGYVCERCEGAKRAKYDPRIFSEFYDADRADVEWSDDY